MYLKAPFCITVTGRENLENEQGVCRVDRGSSPEPVMAASPEHRDDSSSSSSVEIPVKKELEICVDAKQIDSGGDSREAASGDNSRAGVDFALNNGAAEPYSIVHRSFSEVGALRVGTSNIEKLDSSQPKLVKSKTEAPRHRSILAEDAAQIFDNKMSAQKKLQLLNRIATVKDDGTVEFEVPVDVDPHVLACGLRDEHIEVAEEESPEADIQCIPPLQDLKRYSEALKINDDGTEEVNLTQYTLNSSKCPFRYQTRTEYGHRVRLATHSNFKEFVLTAGLEFYPLGGDPKVLAGYMVKNKGFLPSNPSEIPIQRNQMKEIIYSLLPACKEPDPDSGIPFKADAIIANPPAYG
ncbi:hypothetical protein GOBAR_DD30724 [Gossypium barbadense]|nr:hypothetical protein GOBAR_DD30724 [Gossypium barbadense]